MTPLSILKNVLEEVKQFEGSEEHTLELLDDTKKKNLSLLERYINSRRRKEKAEGQIHFGGVHSEATDAFWKVVEYYYPEGVTNEDPEFVEGDALEFYHASKEVIQDWMKRNFPKVVTWELVKRANLNHDDAGSGIDPENCFWCNDDDDEPCYRPIPKDHLFIVWNRTDNVPISVEPVDAMMAYQLKKNFPARFKHQGFYKTAKGELIDPALIDIEFQRYQEEEENNTVTSSLAATKATLDHMTNNLPHPDETYNYRQVKKFMGLHGYVIDGSGVDEPRLRNWYVSEGVFYPTTHTEQEVIEQLSKERFTYKEALDFVRGSEKMVVDDYAVDQPDSHEWKLFYTTLRPVESDEPKTESYFDCGAFTFTRQQLMNFRKQGDTKRMYATLIADDLIEKMDEADDYVGLQSDLFTYHFCLRTGVVIVQLAPDHFITYGGRDETKSDTFDECVKWMNENV